MNLNWDYDRLEEMANNHKTIRKMLGHGSFGDNYEYKLQTLKDNVYLLTPADVTHLLLKRMSIIRPTSICFLMQFGKLSV